jgi:flagellar basal body L-ring protein FlgH
MRTLFAFLAMAAAAQAQSLLRDGGSPYDPPRGEPLRRHDHLQIQFVDKSAPASAAERRSRWDKELKEWVRFDGKDAASVTTITAEVADLRPNGVVVLQALKRRSVNGVEESVKLTGEVAASAVAQGRVSGDSLANLSLAYEGPAAEAAKPGLLGWIFSKVWPF